jgi:hypothetical protein
MRTPVSALLPTRLLASTAVAVLLAGGLAACGGAKDDSLSKSEATSALLSAKNLGDGYKLDTSSDDSDAPGCLKDLDAKTKAPTDENRSFNADNENGFPSVGSQVASYKTEAAAEKAMDAATAAIDKCTSVSFDDSGASTELTITHDSKSLTDGVDAELNITAKGTIKAEGTEVPIALSFAAVRVKNDVAIVTVGDLAEDASQNLATYLKAAVGRLAAVRDGKTPDDTLIDASHRLSESEADLAMLSQGNLGGRFIPDSTADHTSPSPGCLTAVDAISDQIDAPVHVVADYMTNTKRAFPLVSNTVASFDSIADATAALEKFRTDIAACTAVDDKDTDGTATRLTVTDDQTKTDATTSDQVNVQAVGTITGAGGSYPIWLGLAVVRIDNNLTVISVGDLASKAPGDVSQLIKVADARLADVMAGRTPSDAVAGS